LAGKYTCFLKNFNTDSVKVLPEIKTYNQLLELSPEQLSRVDIAVMSLLCAQGLKGSEKLDVQHCFLSLTSGQS
jgi:hypothetical protein